MPKLLLELFKGTDFKSTLKLTDANMKDVRGLGSKAWKGVVGQGEAWRGNAGYGIVAGLGTVRLGRAGSGLVTQGNGCTRSPNPHHQD